MQEEKQINSITAVLQLVEGHPNFFDISVEVSSETPSGHYALSIKLIGSQLGMEERVLYNDQITITVTEPEIQAQT